MNPSSRRLFTACLRRSKTPRPAPPRAWRFERIETLESRIAPATVTVMTTVSDPDPDHPENLAGKDNQYTLKEAIKQINHDHGGTIMFGAPTYTASEALDDINSKVTIMGNPGAGGGPATELTGSGISGMILSKGGTVMNMVINGFTGQGIELDGGGTVENCYIGTDLTGTSAMANHGDGIFVGGSGVTVKDCIVSGNTGDGIGIDGSTVSGVKVQGNKIGVDVTGLSAIPNGFGVFIGSGAHKNLVGGTAPEQRNIISGNTSDGVALQLSPGNTIEGNYIGVGIDGTTKLGNKGNGISIDGGSGNIIGGKTTAARNVIAFSGNAGILIDSFAGGHFAGAAGTANIVEGNYIGLKADGSAATGSIYGVVLKDATKNIIGGTTSAARNVIAKGANDEIQITGKSSNNIVEGNYLGTGPMGNEGGFGGNSGIAIESEGTGNIVGGKSAGARNIIAGHGSSGIYLGGTSNTVEGNYIGLDVSGQNVLQNRDGIVVFGGSQNIIQKNVISGNSDSGITVDLGNSNFIRSNFIGLTADGAAPLHTTYGIILKGGAKDNVIGGTTSTARNVLAYAGNREIQIEGSSTGNMVQGNFIGTGPTGTESGFGGFGGIEIDSTSTGNIIGGTSTGARNIISGHLAAGIFLKGDSNTIEGNYLGVDVSGKIALQNSDAGIDIEGSQNTIQKNVISGNGGDGIMIKTGGTNTIIGNFIGTDTKNKLMLGNGGNGIHTTSSSNNILGGLGKTDGNIIVFNSANGILFDGGSGNLIKANSLQQNTQLGISLTGGANGGQAAPLIATAAKSGAKYKITGSVAGAASTNVTFELYANKLTDASGAGEGLLFLGEVTATTDASGNFTALFSKAPPSGYTNVSLTARVTNGTSAFSADKAV